MELWRRRDGLVTGERFALSLALVRTGARCVGMALLVVLLAGCGPTSPTTRTTASAHPSKASPSPTPLFAFPVASGVSCPDLAALGLERALLNASDQNHPDRRDVILCDARDAA